MFIVIESTEGGGKGNLCQTLGRFFQMCGTPWFHARQPGGTELGEKIRELLLNHKNNITLQEEVMLLAISRKRALTELILPQLDRGKIVICERWHTSTVAYQGYARNINSFFGQDSTVSNIQDLFRSMGLLDRIPDLSVLLDMEAETGLNRIQRRGYLDRFERQPLTFHQAATEAFRKFHREKVRWCMKDSAFIDTTQPYGWMVKDFLEMLADKGIADRSDVDRFVTHILPQEETV